MQILEILGKVIEVVKQGDDGVQVLKVELNTRKTSELCSLGASSSDDVKSSCEGCSGCSAGGNQTGVFAVKGNVLEVLNDTGNKFYKNEILMVYTTRKKQIIQSLISLGIPVSFATIGFSVLFGLTKNEGLAIGGLFFGLTIGVLVVLLISRLNRRNFLPRVKKI